jgi:hypothetical protein
LFLILARRGNKLRKKGGEERQRMGNHRENR